MVNTANIGAAYAASKAAKKRQLEYDQCDEPEIDIDKESFKLSEYDDLLENSGIAQKCRKYILAKKIIYLGLEGLCILLFIIFLSIGIPNNIEPLKVGGSFMFFVALLVLIWPAFFVFNNKIYFRLYKGKLCFVYLTTFKRKIYFNERLLATTKRDGMQKFTANNIKIEIYNSTYTYWISFNNEKPLRKRFGQYY